MKKTLTVNLGGTVYHIDEDAYGLLDQYLSSLRSCFKSQQDAGEIVNDIEGRISEIFSDLICNGQQLITISDLYLVFFFTFTPLHTAGQENHFKVCKCY